MIDISTAILIAAALVMVSAFTSVLAHRYGAPLLLVFLALGLIVGEDGLGIEFDNAPLAYHIGGLALAIILFDSGFATKFASFKAAAAPALILASVGVATTAGLVGVAAHWIFDLSWLECLLIGAIISSTDAAAVFFLLRAGGITVQERIRATLEVESGSNDPMAIFLTVAAVELLIAGSADASWQDFLLIFVRQMGLGLGMGLAGGFLIVRIANGIDLEPSLYPIAVLAAALAVFGATGAIGGSGFLAAYVAGLYSGNRPIAAKGNLRRFQSGVTWLAQITMFLVLGLLATPSQFAAIALQAVALALFLIFVGRPIAVWLCLLPFRYKTDQTAFIAWVGLRGAVSILLGILPLAHGLPSGQLIFDVAFIMVLTSLLVQGWTLGPVANWLRLVVPPRIGPVERLELDLPGSTHELVAYRVAPESAVAKGERIPRWARPSLVLREGRSIRYQYAGRLQSRDQVYLFAPPHYLRLLDRLFASPTPLSSDDADFFGAFTINPAANMAELEKAYHVPIERDVTDLTIGSYIERRLGGHAEIGDRILLGDLELIVRDTGVNGTISDVGLSIEPSKSGWLVHLFDMRKIAAYLKNLWRGRWR